MKYFSYEELTRSDTARHRGITNRPGAEERASLRLLTDRLLDPVRELWGAPLRVTSGYRCRELNRAVGGAARSHHLRGMAADITTGSAAANGRLVRLILASGLRWTQLIAEKGTPDAPRWIHLSYDPADLRNSYLYLP